MARQGGLIDARPEAAIDATGLESRHTSRYYVWRRGNKRHARYTFPKLTLVCHTHSYLFASALVSPGPSQDSPQLPETLRSATRRLSIDRLLADAGYDGEHNHVLARRELGIRSTVIALNKRNTRKWPTGRYRRQMRRRFQRRIYGHRWHIEAAISQTKRRLGSALRSTSETGRECECRLRVLTHDLMILRLVA